MWDDMASFVSASDLRNSRDPIPPGARYERLPDGHESTLPSARRAESARLQREIEVATASPIVSAVLDASDSMVVVLNPERQIVAFNGRLPGAEGDVRGLRPGEVLGCVNAASGCGAAPACKSCGALGAVLACQDRQRPIEAECSIRSERRLGTSLEFNARAVPVQIEDCTFTVLSLRDVSAEKRRQVLEQVFFHDVLNTVAGLRNWSALLQRAPADPGRAAGRIQVLARQIEEEIRHHRTLLDAENGTLVPELAPVRAAEVLEDLGAVFAEHPLARDRRLELDGPPDLSLATDRSLLVRTLVNAVANALEASPAGEAVRVSAAADEGGVRFEVQNAGVMPATVQARVFQRSFSTKAARGRGLGTYSMKLFGERCLGGRVSFASRKELGTVFTIWLPARVGASAVR
jgi:signal transduction histidine kinase